MNMLCQVLPMARRLNLALLAVLSSLALVPGRARAEEAFERIDRVADKMLRYRGDDRTYLLAMLREQFSMSCAQPVAGAEVDCEVQDGGLLHGLSYTQAPFPNLEGRRLLYRIEFRLAANCHASLPHAWGELAKPWHQQAAAGPHGVEASPELVKSTGRRRATLSGVFGSHADCPGQVGMHTLFLSIVSEGRQ
ncbi:MAG TPA: hypothetical protein VK195_14635 [Burkholderiaceae bacterium]|nr:hypothetical protein [Burkholderiaceae bacterium]